jgi:Tol biopolymer transport system component
MPAALSSIVGRCLEKEPDMRFHSAADLAFALETLVTASSPVVSPAPKSAGSRTRPALALFAVLGAAVAGAFLAGKRAGLAPVPVFHRLTFRRGYVDAARFAPDGQTIIYAASWEGTPVQLYSTRKGSPETTPLGSPETLLLGVSSKGELALLLRPGFVAFSWLGTLARAPLAGGAPREVLNDVQEADWSPDGASLAVVRASMEGHSRLEFPLGTMLLASQGRLAQPRISRDGRLVAFLDHPGIEDLGSSVAVVDRESQMRILSSGWANARGLAWSPKGDEVWFTASKSGRAQALWAVNLSGGERLVGRWGGSWNLHDVLPDGRALLTFGGFESSMVATTSAGERDLSWLDSSIARDISADGSLVLFDESGEGVGAHHVAYVRRLDGTPASRLGEGSAAALSPDGRWALVYRAHPLPSLVVIPTGAGEDKVLPRGTIAEYDVEKFLYAATFFPDGKRVVFRGAESGKPHRLFLQDVEGGLPRPFGEDSLLIPLVSPDGRWIAAYSSTSTEKEGALLSEKAGALLIYTSEGQLAKKVALERGDAPIRWGQDSRSLYLRRREKMLVRVFRLELQSGRRQLWREVKPQDPAGFLRGTYTTNISPDGNSIVCTYLRALNDLYLVEGLK